MTGGGGCGLQLDAAHPTWCAVLLYCTFSLLSLLLNWRQLSSSNLKIARLPGFMSSEQANWAAFGSGPSVLALDFPNFPRAVGWNFEHSQVALGLWFVFAQERSQSSWMGLKGGKMALARQGPSRPQSCSSNFSHWACSSFLVSGCHECWGWPVLSTSASSVPRTGPGTWWKPSKSTEWMQESPWEITPFWPGSKMSFFLSSFLPFFFLFYFLSTDCHQRQIESILLLQVTTCLSVCVSVCSCSWIVNPAPWLQFLSLLEINIMSFSSLLLQDRLTASVLLPRKSGLLLENLHPHTVCLAGSPVGSRPHQGWMCFLHSCALSPHVPLGNCLAQESVLAGVKPYSWTTWLANTSKHWDTKGMDVQ